MAFLKKHFFLLILTLFVYLLYFFTQFSFQSPIPAIPSNKATVLLFEQPQSGRTPIIEAIDSAREQVLVEMYLLSDKQIIDALIKAHKRGARVRVMLEEHPFGGGNVNQKTKGILDKSNIEFKWTNPSFSLTHEKGIVIDRKKTFILNQNLTDSAFSKNREYNIINYDPQDILEQEKVFTSDWERKPFTKLLKSDLVVSPINARATITHFFNSSLKSINIETETIEDPKIIELLRTKARNVKVRIILPTFSQIPTNQSGVTTLKKAGVSVRSLSSPYIHAKLFIIDGRKAYVGSINLSAQSMDENREIGILLSQPYIVSDLSTNFENDWSLAQDL